MSKLNRHSLPSRIGALLVMALATIVLAPLPASAQPTLRGVALVIGNGDYAHLPSLANPENDADAIEAMLSDLGFDSVRRVNRDAATLARDLERFAEDAAGADVAVLYYSGHGIEAGGENFLIPVDADLSALGDASTKLVPLSPLIAKLQNEVAVTIALLDACRDSPFPADVTLKVTPDAAPITVSASGLSLDTRGAVALTTDPAAMDKTLGTVIGFAAEPGKVALDGDPGTNSPYAAALLRHFSAMAGMEFGTVMRMVASEVYLKTNARQRPWVNESLVRLLYFGETPALPAGEDGDILAERRGLLLRIDALPDLERRQVEMAALDSGVPMDALYGMLNVLGAAAPAEGEALDAVLRAQTARLKQILAERQALKSADPEIVRLSALADQAIAEGALATALKIHEQAKARVREIEAGLQQAAADLSARFVEAADVYARSAAAYEIAYDYGKAASDYAEAFRLVERWDDQLAWEYKNADAFALNRHADHVGGREISERAVDASRTAADIASRETHPLDWATSQDNLAYALRTLGLRDGDASLLEDALAAMRGALDAQRRETDPLRWARTMGDTALVLRDLAILQDDAAKMEEAVSAAYTVLEELTRERDPREWAMAETNLGNILIAAARRSSAPGRMAGEAVSAYRAALDVLTPESALFAWTLVQNNLADALLDFGKQGNVDAAREASTLFREVLAKPIRTTQPRQWAKAQTGLALALSTIGTYGDGTAELAEAVPAFRAALEEYTLERDPRSFSMVQQNLGATLITLGQRETGTGRFAEAVDALAAARSEYARRKSGQSVIVVAYLSGNALRYWGEREDGTEHLDRAASAYRDGLDLMASVGWRPYFGPLQQNLGDTLLLLSDREGSVPKLEEAVAAYRAAAADYQASASELSLAIVREKLGNALIRLGGQTKDRAIILEGRDAIAAAWDYHKSNGNAAFAGHFEALLADADARLKALGG